MARQQQRNKQAPTATASPEADWPHGRYRLQQPHYMRATPQAEHQAVLRAGAEVEFAGRPSQAMTPLDDAARQAVARRDAELARAQEASFAPEALLQGLSARQLALLQERLAARVAQAGDTDEGGRGDER